MRRALLVLFVLFSAVFALAAAPLSAETREIPVYPGAKLVTEPEPGRLYLDLLKLDNINSSSKNTIYHSPPLFRSYD